MSKIKGINRLVDEYSIDELRMLGKNLGVKSPTGMTKEDLAARVLAALKLQQQQKLETRGRPSDQKIKMLEEFSAQPVAESKKEEVNLAQKYSASKIVDYGKGDSSIYSGVSSARLASNINDYEIVDGEFYIGQHNFGLGTQNVAIKHEKGFVDRRSDGWIFRVVNKGMEIPVSIEQLQAYGFEQYDSVEFSALFSPSENRYYLLEIHAINGVAAEKKEDKVSFEDLKIEVPSECYDGLSDSKILSQIKAVSNIFKGGRILFGAENQEFRLVATKELEITFLSKGVQVLAVMVDTIKETEAVMSADMDLVQVIPSSLNPEEKCEKFLTTIFRAQKYVELGQEVVLIINDFDAVADILSCLITDKNPNYICSLALKFFNLGGAYNNGGKLTIFAFASEKNLRLIERLKRSSTVFVPVDNNGIKIHEIQTQLQSFFMDEEAITVASDIKRVLESLEPEQYIAATRKIASLKGASRKDLLQAIYKI